MSAEMLLARDPDDWKNHNRDWTEPRFRLMAIHRFGVWQMAISPRVLRGPSSILYRMLYRHCRTVYGIELLSSVSLGQGVIIEHQGGIVIHGASNIGDGSQIGANAVVLDNVPANALMLGILARIAASHQINGERRNG